MRHLGTSRTTHKRCRKKLLRDNKGQVILYNSIDAISKSGISRIARRGGVRRISNSTFHLTRVVLKQFVENAVRDAIMYMQHARRSTITTVDVCYALHRCGQTLYTF